MNKYFLVIARYKDEKQEIFDNHISPINQKYCDKHGFEYVVIGNDEPLELVRDNPTWWKFTVVQDWINKGQFGEGTMLPKIHAAIYFLEHHGQKVVITSLNKIEQAINGEAGTIITKEK